MAANVKQQTMELLSNPQNSRTVEEILNSVVKLECLEEVLELVDLGKRREATLYSQEYKDAIGLYILNFDFTTQSLKEFDQFLMQLILSGSSLVDQPLKFYKNLNRLAICTINALYNLKTSNLKTQSAMYHMQMTAGEASIRINELEKNEFYISKARQHFVMAVNFVQEMSVLKAFQSQCRVSDMSIQLLLENEMNAQYIEQAIVDTHNAVEFGKVARHNGVISMLERYSDLCDLLSDYRPDERAYWIEFSSELKAQSHLFETY